MKSAVASLEKTEDGKVRLTRAKDRLDFRTAETGKELIAGNEASVVVEEEESTPKGGAPGTPDIARIIEDDNEDAVRDLFMNDSDEDASPDKRKGEDLDGDDGSPEKRQRPRSPTESYCTDVPSIDGQAMDSFMIGTWNNVCGERKMIVYLVFPE